MLEKCSKEKSEFLEFLFLLKNERKNSREDVEKRKVLVMCSGENKSRKRIADQSGSMHCHCPTWSSTNDDGDDEPQL